MRSDVPTQPPIIEKPPVFDTPKILGGIDAWKQVELKHRPLLEVVNYYSQLDRKMFEELLKEFKEID